MTQNKNTIHKHKINRYIFISREGYTFAPEEKTENPQIIGSSTGRDAKEAFDNLIRDNEDLLDSTFDEVAAIELKHLDYPEHIKIFHIDDKRIPRR